jgi:hypothetical protein
MIFFLWLKHEEDFKVARKKQWNFLLWAVYLEGIVFIEKNSSAKANKIPRFLKEDQ